MKLNFKDKENDNFKEDLKFIGNNTHVSNEKDPEKLAEILI